jgi:gamma-glutamyltranspeptidase/glutathione hydrolase/leukotriene-C4 hydrolase
VFRLGSKQVGSRTGIIFNDEIGDFLLPNKFPHPPVDGQPVRYHFANEVAPGKRPMSSMCPAIVLDQGGRVNMVIGAAGSTLITSATAYVRCHCCSEKVKCSVTSLRDALK